MEIIKMTLERPDIDMISGASVWNGMVFMGKQDALFMFFIFLFSFNFMFGFSFSHFSTYLKFKWFDLAFTVSEKQYRAMHAVSVAKPNNFASKQMISFYLFDVFMHFNAYF